MTPDNETKLIETLLEIKKEIEKGFEGICTIILAVGILLFAGQCFFK